MVKRSQFDRMTVLKGKARNDFEIAHAHVEKREFDEALEAVERGLKRAPQNAELITLKGMIVYYLGEKKEGFKIAKEGVLISLKSKEGREKSIPFCYRMYGLMFKEEQSYKKAISSFVYASKLDKDNIGLLKDTLVLQSMIGDWAGLVETRRKLIANRPDNTNQWLGLAVAFHMQKEYSQALGIIENWIKEKNEKIKLENDKIKKIENQVVLGRVLLYKLTIIFESGQYQKALALAKKMESSNFIGDKDVLNELKAKSFYHLKEYQKARDIYGALFTKHFEDHGFLKKLLRTFFVEELKDDTVFENFKILDENASLYQVQREKVIDVITKLSEKNAKSETLKRVILTVMKPGKEFKQKFEHFIVKFLRGSVPSLFNQTLKMYENTEKVKIIEELFLNYETELNKTHILPIMKENKDEMETEKENPASFLWIMLFLAQHFDKLKNSEKALEYIEKAIDHTPTLLELYLIKGRILRHANRLPEALKAIELSRKLDLADRFLNTKCVKYLLLNDKIEEAYETAFIFAKDQKSRFNLHEMQGIQFEYYLGLAHMRKNQFAAAMLQFYRIRSYFNKLINFSSDYHSLFFQNGSMLAYYDALKYFKYAKKNKKWFTACVQMIRCFLWCNEHKKEVEILKVTYKKRVARETIQDKRRRETKYELLSTNYVEKSAQIIEELKVHYKDNKEIKELESLIEIAKKKQ